MFFVSLTYIKPLDKVDAHISAHVDYMNQQYREGRFLASGRKVPRKGGVILSNMSDRKMLEDIIRQDPFHKHQIADYDIIEFTPTMTRDELEFLKSE